MKAASLRGCPPISVLNRFVSLGTPDPEASAIDSHIDHCSACQNVVEELLKNVDSHPSLEQMLCQGVADTPSSSLDQINHYRVVEELGRGTFGVVYRAWDNVLDRHVAIKVPHPSIVRAAGGSELYLKEARVLARLDHSHIIQVYEVGTNQSGSCFLVTQDVAGKSLDAYLSDNHLNTHEAAGLVARMADALQHAHEHGIWHRDVKPANILLDQRGKPYLADFGLALKEDEIGTGPGFVGTPAYMSPEQARGEGHQVDGRTDIFSLGIVFYKLLTGKRPFLAESVDDLVRLVVNIDAPSVRQSNRSIPRELDRICAKALARQLPERYGSAGDMADDLNRWQETQGSAATAQIAPEVMIPIRRAHVTGNRLDGSDSPQRSIGGFQILGQLGRGGMGIVYRAWQPVAERNVALKCLTLNDQAAQARFSTEIRALGKVAHPNLVRVYTSGMDGNQFFFAMELIEGTGFKNLLRHLPDTAKLDNATWREVVRKAAVEVKTSTAGTSSASTDALCPDTGSLDPSADSPKCPTNTLQSAEYVRRMTAIIRDIAKAIQALHEKGVIHRDVKPANIMLANDGQRAVLMDLGIAKLTGTDDNEITLTRQFVGSIRYASPEQVLDSAQVDHRTDIYSLGATLWELLTLRPIYGINTGVNDARAMLKIEIEDPQPVRRFNRGVPADLQAIIEKCLEKDPEHRYRTAAELSDDLDRWLLGNPVQARPVTALTRWVRRVRRKPLVPALLLTVILLASILSTFIWPFPDRESGAMRIGIKPWVGFCPLVVASELDLCDAADLNLVPVRTTADVRQRIVAGEIDVAPYLVDSHALAQADRTPTKVVLQLDVSLTADAVVTSEGLDSFSALKGHRIAYMHHEAPHFLLLSLCEKFHIDPDNFDHIKTETVQEAVNCFLAGEADAVVCYEPFVHTALARDGAFRLASAADDPGAIIDILTVRDDYLDSNKDRVKGLIEAWMKGLELLEHGDPKALAIACRFLGSDDQPITPREYYEMARGMRYAGRAENLRFFRPDASGSSEFHKRMRSAQQRWDRHHQLSRMTNPRHSDRSDLLFELYESSADARR